MEIAQVLDFGAQKYDAHNWRVGISWTRVASAVLRHIYKWIAGQNKDEESGLSHLAHAACGLLFLLTYEKTRTEFDDRYKDASN